MELKLTSVKMQTVIFNRDFDKEYFMPILRFGKGKNKEFKMPLYIQDEEQVGKCYDEIIKLKGETIEVIRENHDRILEMFLPYSHNNPK